MYRYEYKKIRCDLSGWGAFSGNIYEIDDFKSVISSRAAQGWRYVGFIPTKQRGTGHIQELELIFEKSE